MQSYCKTGMNLYTKSSRYAKDLLRFYVHWNAQALFRQKIAPMHETSRLGFLDATQEAGKAFYRRQIEGSVVMMNLLKFRQIADYSGDQDLAPSHEVSGEEAYRLYMKHTLPFLLAAGGEVIFRGKAGPFLIGPAAEDWDLVLLVRHQSVSKFLAFANDDEYQSGIGHRTAALIDSRLLPLEQVS